MRRTTIAAVIVLAACVTAQATCGERGGPGYRGPDGKCVSWLNIGRICGSPPEKSCTAEGVRTGAGEAAKLGNKIHELRLRALKKIEGAD
jgi:hypothetical protein